MWGVSHANLQPRSDSFSIRMTEPKRARRLTPIVRIRIVCDGTDTVDGFYKWPAKTHEPPPDGKVKFFDDEGDLDFLLDLVAENINQEEFDRRWEYLRTELTTNPTPGIYKDDFYPSNLRYPGKGEFRQKKDRTEEFVLAHMRKAFEWADTQNINEKVRAISDLAYGLSCANELIQEFALRHTSFDDVRVVGFVSGWR